MKFELRVTSARRETPNTQLVRVDLAGAPFVYRAGQAALIGPAGSAPRVPYSIASAPAETEVAGSLTFLIKTDQSGAWGEEFPALRRGALLSVEGPIGSFAFPESPRESHFLFIAGGTGISPLRSMIRQAVMTGVPGTRRLLYSARTPNDFAFVRELRGMAKRGEIELALTATRESQRRWRGLHGRIATERLAALVDDPSTLCFVCGPAAMVAEVPAMLLQLGVSRERIRVEDW